MKTLLLSLVCLFALVTSLPLQAKAQDSADASSSQSSASSGWPSPDEVVSRLSSQLSLTDDQKAKITPIITARQQKLKEIASSSTRRRKKAREMRSVVQDSDKKIKAVLTGEQQQQYEQMEQQMRAQMRQRMQQRSSQ